MNAKKSFLKSGHLPTLIASFLYFDISFMIWVLLGITSTFIASDLQLSSYEKGLMVGLPILGGALLRIPMGLLADRFGGKITGMGGMIITMIPLLWGCFFANSISEIYLLGILLGVAGASFAVALPLASRWYPPEHQGLAMGIAGAGNSGTVLASLFAPRLAQMVGWHAVYGLALIPLVITFIVFVVLAKDCPNSHNRNNMAAYLSLLKERETWFFSFFYSLSFGGFVGLTSYLSIFFVDQYSVSKVTAGDFVTLVVIAGSAIRPIGGYFADKIGGMRMLSVLFVALAIVFCLVGMMPSVYINLGLLFLTFLLFGLANGALFQVIPTSCPDKVGLMTGFVGAAGGLGGFFLPTFLGTLKELTGSYADGFWFIAAIFLIAIGCVAILKKSWSHNDSEIEHDSSLHHI
ncbi:MAG: nitrate/nitrite transporter [Firmicutes bacterium]|nr:nitrate/nitrite transporter [Bacillota bacterium]